jgi:hypothetical protein
MNASYVSIHTHIRSLWPEKFRDYFPRRHIGATGNPSWYFKRPQPGRMLDTFPDAAKHLVWLRDELDDRFVAGLVLRTRPRMYQLSGRITAYS